MTGAPPGVGPWPGGDAAPFLCCSGDRGGKPDESRVRIIPDGLVTTHDSWADYESERSVRQPATACRDAVADLGD